MAWGRDQRNTEENRATKIRVWSIEIDSQNIKRLSQIGKNGEEKKRLLQRTSWGCLKNSGPRGGHPEELYKPGASRQKLQGRSRRTPSRRDRCSSHWTQQWCTSGSVVFFATRILSVLQALQTVTKNWTTRHLPDLPVQKPYSRLAVDMMDPIAMYLAVRPQTVLQRRAQPKSKRTG